MSLKKDFNKRASFILPSDNSTVLNPQTFKEGFSQSEIGVWDDCAEKWYLGYNHRLRRKGGFEWHFIYGDGVHASLEKYYKTGHQSFATLQLPEGVILTGEQQFEFEKWQEILNVQMERYYAYYPDDLVAWGDGIWAVEKQVQIEFEGIILRGKIDLGFDNVLMDHKTYALDDYEGWQFRFQFMFYVWLAQKATGKKIEYFTVNGIKKPALRQGKDESLASFCVRIKQNMIQEPEKYFVRTPLHMLADSMEHFEERVLRPKLNRIKLLTQDTTPDILIESLVRNQNTSNCVNFGSCCEFLPICKHGFKREGAFYIQRNHKHSELQPCKTK